MGFSSCKTGVALQFDCPDVTLRCQQDVMVLLGNLLERMIPGVKLCNVDRVLTIPIQEGQQPACFCQGKKKCVVGSLMCTYLQCTVDEFFHLIQRTRQWVHHGGGSGGRLMPRFGVQTCNSLISTPVFLSTLSPHLQLKSERERRQVLPIRLPCWAGCVCALSWTLCFCPDITYNAWLGDENQLSSVCVHPHVGPLMLTAVIETAEDWERQGLSNALWMLTVLYNICWPHEGINH